METMLEQMCEAVERHAAHARHETAVPGLTLYRVNQAALPSHVF